MSHAFQGCTTKTKNSNLYRLPAAEHGHVCLSSASELISGKYNQKPNMYAMYAGHYPLADATQILTAPHPTKSDGELTLTGGN